MLVSCVFAKVRAIAGTLAAAATMVVANPAQANSSASAADIAAPLRAAQSAKASSLNNGDDQFRQLFASWQSLEKSAVPALAAVADARDMASAGQTRAIAAMPFGSFISTARGGVSIPSRVPVAGIRLSSEYGMRTHPVLGGRRAHKGVDLAGPMGTPIHATADGVISKAEWFSSYGLYVAIEHGGKIQTRYGHMSRLAVASGQRVRKGDVIGFMGSTGRSTGSHLHYEVRIDGTAVNPIPYMQADEMRAALVSDVRTGGQGGPE